MYVHVRGNKNVLPLLYMYIASQSSLTVKHCSVRITSLGLLYNMQTRALGERRPPRSRIWSWQNLLGTSSS